MARRWDEVMLQAIRLDVGRPTVAARNLFHVSIAMYDAWAAYDPVARGYLVQEKAGAPDIEAARGEAISFAAYRVLSARFAPSPSAGQIQTLLDTLMASLGYDRSNTSTEGDSPAAVGNRIAAAVVAFGSTDGSNEANNYADTTGYAPVNPPLDITASGTNTVYSNRWQPLIINGQTQRFLTPQWGQVTPFALPRISPTTQPYFSAAQPPQLGGSGDPEYKAQAQRTIRYSSWLDSSDGAVIDVSPRLRGNNTLGMEDGLGHPVIHVTADDYTGRIIGSLAGKGAYFLARQYFQGTGAPVGGPAGDAR